MTTRTIRETDITIFDFPRTNERGARRIYQLREKYRPNPTDEVFSTYAEALQTRADIIDGRAGAARVGDLVRIGLKGQVTYRVTSVGEDGTVLVLSKDAAGHHRFRRVEVERLHVVEARR